MERVTFLKPFGVPQAPPERGAGGARNLGRLRRPKFFFFYFLSPPKTAYAKLTPRPGRPRHPKFYFNSFTAAEGGGFPNGCRRRPNGGAEGATSPEGEGNPAEGGSSRVFK